MASQAPEEERIGLERRHVHEVYNQIAPHFTDITHRAWPKVRQFLKSLPPGSLVADVGCGNGRYLRVNRKIYKLGSDRCEGFVNIAQQRGHEVMVCDNLQLPYRDGVFDAAISIAVIHHFATIERRIKGLRELARIIQPGGKILICVWAFEQKHRRFDGQDVLVPWNKPVKVPRKRATSKSSLGTSSEFSSTSSISEDDLTQELVHTRSEDQKLNVSRANSHKSEVKPLNSGASAKHGYIRCNGDLKFGSVDNGINGREAHSRCSVGNHGDKCRNHGHCSSGCGGEVEDSISDKFNSTVEPSHNLASSSTNINYIHSSEPLSSTTGLKTKTVLVDGDLQQQVHRPPVRPSSLHLRHRHTAVLGGPPHGHKSSIPHDSQQKHIPGKSQVTKHSTKKLQKAPLILDKQWVKDTSRNAHSNQSHGNNGSKCNLQNSQKPTLKENVDVPNDNDHQTLSKCPTRRPVAISCFEQTSKCQHIPNGERFSVMERSSDINNPLSIMKQVSHKTDAVPVLSVPSTVNHMSHTQESSLLIKLKALFAGKSKESTSSSLTKNEQGESLRWHDYYNRFAKDLEDDLDSFKSFCSLINSENSQDIFFREFVVREFPRSSQLSIHKESETLREGRRLDNNVPYVLEGGSKKHRKASGKVSLMPESDIHMEGGATNPSCGGRSIDGNGNVCVVQRVERKSALLNENRTRLNSTHQHSQRNGEKDDKSKDISSVYSITNGEEDVADDVFEDFASSMSTCLTNLSRAREMELTPCQFSPANHSTCQRYYHVFKEGELEDLIRTHVPGLHIISSYFDHANWCLIAEKKMTT